MRDFYVWEKKKVHQMIGLILVAFVAIVWIVEVVG